MSLFTLRAAAEAMRGTLIGGDAEVLAVCADSREAEQGSLFFALPGERVDGHDFVVDARRRGAIAAAVERGRAQGGGPEIHVADCRLALGALAGWYRSKMPAKVVAVTGSTGKTTTKEMIAAALKPLASVHKSFGNLNTEIGVPLSIFDLEPDHTVSVLEMGMRGVGQIRELCEIARPSVGVVTNVGWSHIGELGSREAIADAKGELIAFLPSSGVAVLNADSDMTPRLRSRAACPVLTFGKGGDVEVIEIEQTDAGLRVGFNAFGRIVRGEIKVPGAFHAANAAAALAVAGALNLDVERAAQGLAETVFPPNRMQILEFGTTRVLADMYNSAPDSLEAALRALAQIPAKRRVAVLGGMLELGDFAEAAHRQVGGIVAALGIEVLGVVGREAEWIAEGAETATKPMEGAIRLETTEAAAEWLPRILRSGDLVLIKGSRALRMERLLDAISPGVTA